MDTAAPTPDGPLDRFQQRCAELGLARTTQRLAVYRALAASHEHPSAEELFLAVKPAVPSLSLGTVYRILELFERHSLIARVHTGGDEARFDANIDDHHHLVCIRCRRVADYSDDALASLPLREERPAGFRILGRRVQFLGVCPACDATENSAPPPLDTDANDS